MVEGEESQAVVRGSRVAANFRRCRKLRGQYDCPAGGQEVVEVLRIQKFDVGAEEAAGAD
jgi:hypothetical protein